MIDLEGWFNDDCGQVYRNLVRQIPHDGKIIETGIFKGRSTAILAKECIGTQRQIRAIDTWEGTPGEITKEIMAEQDVLSIFLNNMKELGYDKFVTPWKINSVYAAKIMIKSNAKFDLILLDANHYTHFVEEEILIWLQCLKSTGIIGGHDYYQTVAQGGQGVRKAVDKIFQDNKNFALHVKNYVWYVEQNG